ncbi:alpha/beta hydrolase [Telmatospirillum sp.]|uniref:alpha/beta hydrolase n=1 Tax=Telmatospirillum sp. TaxID=2079197 RepID=UPI00283DBFF7|nr:alpha/beta hydrolase [Telmatospirillum sp.]MDR3436159.1 alpha/beta hydrolase [Telmatospirillum sp.]
MSLIIVWFSLTLPLSYLVVAFGLALAQRRLLYRPPPEGVSDPTLAPEMATIRQGPTLLGWWQSPPDPISPILVFFHGNRGTLNRIATKTAPWREEFHLGLFLATYRGYEGNPGNPSEAGLYDDGRAVLDWLTHQGFSAERLILYGESLGTGVATQLAIERHCLGVVLEAPFSSIPDIAMERYPWAPSRWLVRDTYDNRAKIGDITSPILLLHGDADRTIPLAHSQRLAAAAPSAQLAVVPQATHRNVSMISGQVPL